MGDDCRSTQARSLSVIVAERAWRVSSRSERTKREYALVAKKAIISMALYCCIKSMINQTDAPVL